MDQSRQENRLGNSERQTSREDELLAELRATGLPKSPTESTLKTTAEKGKPEVEDLGHFERLQRDNPNASFFQIVEAMKKDELAQEQRVEPSHPDEKTSPEQILSDLQEKASNKIIQRSVERLGIKKYLVPLDKAALFGLPTITALYALGTASAALTIRPWPFLRNAAFTILAGGATYLYFKARQALTNTKKDQP